jgi:hypothetical protein
MPKVIGSNPVDRWENEVLKAFKQQLPREWMVLNSVGWSMMKNGYVREGQADFVILVPDSGLVVVEVKGSKEFKVDEAGIWHRKENGQWIALQESPPEQASRNMHDLVKILKDECQWRDFPGRYAYLVVYPQGETRDLDMFDESTVATWRHMNQLASRVRNALEKRGSERLGHQFSSIIMESAAVTLKNLKARVIKVDSGDDVKDDKSKIEQLTQQQLATLRGLFDLPRVAVMGPAGSGKTVLALWRLKAHIEEGRRAIYVCYNKKLASALQLLHPDHAEFIWNVDRLFRKLSPEAAVPADTRRLGEFFGQDLPGLVVDKVMSVEKYDAIIVDEGQDFTEFQLMALYELLVGDGFWSLFADRGQNLYRDEEMGVPYGAEVVFTLHHNCRNTIKINEAANHYAKKAIQSMPGMPEGVSPIIEVTRNQAGRAWELAKQWSGEGAIAILSPYSLELSAMKGQKSGHGLRLSEDIKDLGAKDMVYFSTIRSFKGIEASVVIVVDLDIPGEKDVFGQEDLYVATTRATTRLAMLSSKSEVIDFFKSEQ